MFLSPPAQYEVEESDLPSCTLWVSVWDWDRFGKNKFLGEVRLPLSAINFSDDSEQWYQLYEKVRCSATYPSTYTVDSL